MKVIGKKILYDVETAQEVKVLLVGNLNKTTYQKDKDFVKIFTAFLEDIVDDKELAGKSIRLLLYMLKKLEYNTLLIELNPDDVIRELKITKRTFYAWTKQLVQKNIIKKLSARIFRLQPGAVIKGQLSKIPDREVSLVNINI